MPISFRCPACQHVIRLSSRKAGREIPCPACGRLTRVPRKESPAAAGSVLEPAGKEFPVQRSIAEHGTPKESLPEPGKSPRGSAAGNPEKVPSPWPGDGLIQPDTGGFQVRARKVEADEMDLTPMVDMTFLLLIFFMITASFSVQKSIAFPPPSPDQKGAAQATHTLEELENSSIIVRIDGRNAITVDDEPLNDPGRIVDVFRAALTTRRNEVVVMADDETLHETVVAVIDAANAAGMQKIRLATRTND